MQTTCMTTLVMNDHGLLDHEAFSEACKEVTVEVDERCYPVSIREAGLRFTPEALECLQQVTEDYLARLFTEAQQISTHTGRVKVLAKDMELALALRESTPPMYHAHPAFHGLPAQPTDHECTDPGQSCGACVS